MIERFMIERKTVNGEEVTRRVPYEAPMSPAREYVIVERETGAPILEKPGGRKAITESRDGKNGKRATKVVGDEPQPFVPLTDPRDQMHATKFTEEEAIERARLWKLSRDTHKITRG